MYGGVGHIGPKSDVWVRYGGSSLVTFFVRAVYGLSALAHRGEVGGLLGDTLTVSLRQFVSSKKNSRPSPSYS